MKVRMASSSLAGMTMTHSRGLCFAAARNDRLICRLRELVFAPSGKNLYW